HFEIESGVFRSKFRVPGDCRVAFQELVRELVEWRLAQYLQRGETETSARSGFTAKVSHNSGGPILFLPDRKKTRDIPFGSTRLIIDDDPYVANFAKVAVNSVHRKGSAQNELPRILRSWFGADAGRPGTSHDVMIVPAQDGQSWTMSAAGRSDKSG